MAWHPGDRVHLPGIGTGFVRAVRNGGRCLVELKGRTMEVPGAALQPADAEPRRAARRPAAAESPVLPRSGSPRDRGGSRQIDLHGLTVEQALEAVDAFLDAAVLDDAMEVRIVHGRSGGRLKAAVHRRLGALGIVRAFRVDAANPGVTIVVL
ncbi:MAG: Smr/MutS family protein [Vicinamibacterales bacterium]